MLTRSPTSYLLRPHSSLEFATSDRRVHATLSWFIFSTLGTTTAMTTHPTVTIPYPDPTPHHVRRETQ